MSLDAARGAASAQMNCYCVVARQSTSSLGLVYTHGGGDHCAVSVSVDGADDGRDEVEQSHDAVVAQLLQRISTCTQAACSVLIQFHLEMVLRVICCN